MKDLDFLPEWYKDRRRRHSRMRKQYMALAAVFLMMMVFNLTATHRAGSVAADLSRCAEREMDADAVVHEFNRVTKELNLLKARASLVSEIDTRFDVAAILAEISHVVDESIVLSRLELVAEPFKTVQDSGPVKGGIGRTNSKQPEAKPETLLGNAKLHIVLAGVATHPAYVADLVSKLDKSSYFQQVTASYDSTKIPSLSSGGAAGEKAAEMMDVTAFQITCYLANYTETETQ